MVDEPAVETAALHKYYAGVPVLDGVDLRVARGSVFALLGPNGAGKTTMVRILATLVRPDRGTARVDGFDVVRQRHQVRRSISLTGQYAAVDALQTGEENLRMMARLHGVRGRRARRRVAELVERFDLGDAAGKRVATYSGGMRRRLDLAASLVGTPSVIFLDEPTTGLDPRSRQAVWEIVTGLAGSGRTILLTTQYLEEADRLADRIALLDRGRVVAEGTAAELKTRVAEQRLELTLVNAAAYDRVSRYLADRAVTLDAARSTLAVATDGSAGHVRALLDEVDPQRVAVQRFAVHTATLDDVFLALTGHATTPSSAPDLEEVGV
jgi:ABC-2 type transport system ATP-binding protein